MSRGILPVVGFNRRFSGTGAWNMGIPLEMEREEVAAIMRRLYRQGLTTAAGGNVSLRCGKSVLLTPSGTDKGEITAEQVGILTLDGENLTPHLKPSMEAAMHLEVLRARPDANAVVHAHPVTAAAFAAMDLDIDCRLTAEAFLLIGTPVRAPYTLMGTKALALAAGDAVLKGDAVLLENHGVLTVGESLLQAFDRLEVLEAAARMTWITLSLGRGTPLGEDRTEEILRTFRVKQGRPGKN